MKKQLVQMVLVIVVALGVVGTVLARPAPTVTPTPTPTTHYFMLNKADDAYILCADGQFTIEVNGRDSLHLVCEGD